MTDRLLRIAYSGPYRRLAIVAGTLTIVGLSLVTSDAWRAPADAPTAALPAPRFTSTSEVRFRAEAIETVRPSCPDQVPPLDGVGVGVAAVNVARSGRVLTVAMLEAPSSTISAAMSDALRQWRFKPQPLLDGHPQVFSGKITFYFVPKGTRCVAANPSDVGYVGRWTPVDRQERTIPTAAARTSTRGLRSPIATTKE